MHVQTMQTLIGLQGGRKCEAAGIKIKKLDSSELQHSDKTLHSLHGEKRRT